MSEIPQVRGWICPGQDCHFLATAKADMIMHLRGCESYKRWLEANAEFPLPVKVPITQREPEDVSLPEAPGTKRAKEK